MEISETTTQEAVYEVIESTLVIHVNGELDHHNSISIRTNADDFIFRNKIKNIVFDFEKTNFMDSSGIGVIMGRYKMVKGFGGIIAVVNAKKNIEKILLFSGLTKILKCYENVKTALENIS